MVRFGKLEVDMARIGLEAGPLSQWLYARMREAGLSVELLETRHVRDAFKAMPVKTDRTDARGIAQLMRLGWFRSVHCKSLPAQDLRAILTARKLVQTKRHDLEMSLRGILRGFGLKVGQTTPRSFEARVRELVDGRRLPWWPMPCCWLVRCLWNNWVSCRSAWYHWLARTCVRGC
jgi:transposase